jgi:hypothetical protein
MTVRAFVVLLLVTVAAIGVGDWVARDFTAPGLERSFAVMVVAAAIIAPVAWLLERAGWIRGGWDPAQAREERRRREGAAGQGQRSGGDA